MQNQNTLKIFIISLLVVLGGFIVWQNIPGWIQNVSKLRQAMEGEWYCKFRMDEEVRNVSQTEWMKLNFAKAGSCQVSFSGKEVIKTLDISDDYKSKSFGSGYTQKENSYQGRYQLVPNWQGVDLFITFPGRTYFSSSFEPFVVTKKPKPDFTDPKSEVEVKASVVMQGDYLVIAADNKEITLARPAEEYINLIPLVRSGAASGDSRYFDKERQRINRDRPDVERFSAERPSRRLMTRQETSNRIIDNPENAGGMPNSNY